MEEQKVNIDDLMNENLKLREKIELLEGEKAQYEVLIEENKNHEKDLENEVARLQRTNHEFFLRLTNQRNELDNNNHQDEKSQVTPSEEEFNFDDFINKLL